jgi:hypothetical protein
MAELTPLLGGEAVVAARGANDGGREPRVAQARRRG